MRWVSLVTLAFVSACTVLGPDFQEPDVGWLRTWQPDLYGQLEVAGEGEPQADRDWWQIFEDPHLNELIGIALNENHDLQLAGLRVLESLAVVGIADSNLLPQVQQISGAAIYQKSHRRGGPTGDSHDSGLGYQAGLALGWELDFWGRFRRGIESADASFFASVANQHDVQVLLISQVADLYFSWRTIRSRLETVRQSGAIQKRSYDITRQIFEAGQGSELDLQQARTQYLATISSIPSLEISETQLRNALCVLLGRPPGKLPELPVEVRPLPVLDPMLVRELPANLLLQRPDVRAAAWRAAAQSAQIGIAEADFYPAISLTGSLGWSSTRSDGSPSVTSLGAGPTAIWNVFDHGRIINTVRVQDARLQQAIESFQNSVLQAAREVDDAAITIVKTGEKQVTLDEALDAAKRSLELANIRYQEGYSGFQRVLDAQQSLFARQEQALINKGDHLSAVIALYKSTGGGWQDVNLEQMISPETREVMRARTDWGNLMDAKAQIPVQSSSESSEQGVSP